MLVPWRVIVKLFNAFGIFAPTIFKGGDPMILLSEHQRVIGSVHELAKIARISNVYNTVRMYIYIYMIKTYV